VGRARELEGTAANQYLRAVQAVVVRAESTRTESSPSHHALDTLLLSTAGACILLWGLGGYPLWDPDEARHAEVARQMLTGHRWLVPVLFGKSYYDKPAPFYILVRAVYAVLGVGELGARLPAALATLATLVLLHRFALPRLGRKAALLGGLIYLTSPEVVALGRFCNLDATLTLFVSTAICFGLVWLEKPSRAPWAVYVSMGAGTLIKGPIAIVLPALALIACAAVRGRLGETARHARVGTGALVVCAITLPWFLAAWHADHAYIETFLLRHNFERYTSQNADHAAGLLYYAPVLAGGLLPWSLLLPLALLSRSRQGEPAWNPAVPQARDPRRTDVAPPGDAAGAARRRVGCERDLAIWALVVVAFFSVSRGKLGTYVLPAYPAIALWLGSRIAPLDGFRTTDLARRWYGGAALLWAAALAISPLPLWLFVKNHYPSLSDELWLSLLLPALGVLVVALVWLPVPVWPDGRARSSRVVPPQGLSLPAAALGRLPRVPLVFAATNGLLVLAFYLLAAPVVSDAASDAILADAMRGLGSEVKLIAFRIDPASLAFYTRRDVRRVDWDGEVRIAADAGPVLIVTRARQSGDLSAVGVPLHTWFEGPRHSLYATIERKPTNAAAERSRSPTQAAGVVAPGEDPEGSTGRAAKANGAHH